MAKKNPYHLISVEDRCQLAKYIDVIVLQCLLVKGWKAGASWSFPRGKKSKDEEDHSCAVREVNIRIGFISLILTNIYLKKSKC